MFQCVGRSHTTLGCAVFSLSSHNGLLVMGGLGRKVRLGLTKRGCRRNVEDDAYQGYIIPDSVFSSQNLDTTGAPGIPPAAKYIRKRHARRRR